jgi:hypothetical protein
MSMFGSSGSIDLVADLRGEGIPDAVTELARRRALRRARALNGDVG